MEQLDKLYTDLMNYQVELEKEDYKVIKCMECSILGEELPYNMEELHLKRQNFRDLINETQDKIEELKNKVDNEESPEIEEYG